MATIVEESPTLPIATRRAPAKLRWREPVALWVGTRLLCVAAIYAGAWLMPCPYDYLQESPAAGPVDDLPAFFARYAADSAALGPRPMVGLRAGGSWQALDPLVRWDAFWYLSVAEVGYVADRSRDAQQNVAFFPAYPLLVRAASAVGIPPLVGALTISNLALLAATCLFYRLAATRFGLRTARWTVGLWLLFPTSFFGVVPYAESLAALAMMLWLAPALDRRYAASGFWAGVTSAIRPQGLLLGIPCLAGLARPGRRRGALLGLALCGAGLAVYMSFLWWRFGNPLLFAEVQRHWRPDASWNPLRWILLFVAGLLFPLAAAARGDVWLLMSSRAVDPYLLAWAVAWLPAVFRRLGWGLAMACAAMFVMPLATGGLASMGRFTWLMLPLFVASGEALSTSRWRWCVAVVSTTLLVWLAALYGGYWMVI